MFAAFIAWVFAGILFLFGLLFIIVTLMNAVQWPAHRVANGTMLSLTCFVLAWIVAHLAGI